MSGSGNSGGDWRPQPKPVKVNVGSTERGGGSGGPDACAIIETTNLNSVDPTVLRDVRVGEILNVVYTPGPPFRLIAQTPAGTALGSITSTSMAQIIQCITQRGYEYVAEIRMIRGAICQVEVRPR